MDRPALLQAGRTGIDPFRDPSSHHGNGRSKGHTDGAGIDTARERAAIHMKGFVADPWQARRTSSRVSSQRVSIVLAPKARPRAAARLRPPRPGCLRRTNAQRVRVGEANGAVPPVQVARRSDHPQKANSSIANLPPDVSQDVWVECAEGMPAGQSGPAIDHLTNKSPVCGV